MSSVKIIQPVVDWESPKYIVPHIQTSILIIIASSFTLAESLCQGISVSVISRHP
ncbi:MAG: hypothetical protein KME23_26360 [Goleter apudmare HA4340-LM2]|nr:hypothetical protein [Goleter apudmare HA4340-LM2]